MSTNPLASSFLNSIDPNFQPFELPDVSITEDRRLAAETLVDLNLEAKASSLVTCGKFFITILQFLNHWARAGRATCHLKFACVDCGTGTCRVHRLMTVAPKRFRAITREVTRTIRLVISHTDYCQSPAEYRARVQADKIKFGKIRKRFLLGGTISSVEMDPEMKDAIFRVYHVGKIVNKGWEKLGASTRIAWDDPIDALRWTLDGYKAILELPGDQRAHWEAAFQGCRLTSNCGSLRGIDVDSPQYEKLSIDAPYGYCPCGCGGVVERAHSHKAESMQSLCERFEQLSFGPLKDYQPYSPKVNQAAGNRLQFTPEIVPMASPPPN